MSSTLPVCRCAGHEPAPSCLFPGTCGRINRSTKVEYANSSSNNLDTESRRAIQSVGALVVPEASWATGFLIHPNWLLTAGHTFDDPTISYAVDAQTAAEYVLIMNHEADGACDQRKTFVLNPLHGENRFLRRHDDYFDYALSRVLGSEIDVQFKPPNIATTVPRIGETIYLIHHAFFARLKQITRGKCRYVHGQRIYVDFKADSGASGGLLVNDKWEAVGLFTNGMTGHPYGYLLGPVLRDLRRRLPENIDFPTPVTQNGTNLGLPGVDPRSKKPGGLAFPGWARHVRKSSLPTAVSSAFSHIGKIYSVGVEPQWARQGTCFVVAENWILTAHHVASCADDANKMGIDFHYDKADTSVPHYHPNAEFFLAPEDGYFASEDGFRSCDGTRYHLDYALVKIRTRLLMPGGGTVVATPIQLAASVPSVESEIFIVQHAGISGLEHKGVLAVDDVPINNRNPFKASDSELVYHLAARAGGTSGAPILNAAGQAFAMHTHEANSANDESNKRTFNWGARIGAIAKDVLRQSPDVLKRHPNLATFIQLAES